jgi:hypothetical protein
LRQAQRYEAREHYRYVVECINRIKYVLKTLPSTKLISLQDWWDASNALNGSEQNTFYHPLFGDFTGQRIEALTTLLAMSSQRHREQYNSLLDTINAQEVLVNDLPLVEKREEVEEEDEADLEGLAQLWTFWELPSERLDALMRIKQSYAVHLEFLESQRRSLEKRL